MEIKYQELYEKRVQELRFLLERLRHPRQDDEVFIRQRSIESVDEYYRVVSIFGEYVAQNISMGVLYDGMFNQD